MLDKGCLEFIFSATLNLKRFILSWSLLMSRNRFSSFFCLLLLVPLVAHAQFAQRGSLEGFVFDSTGAAVPGAQVTLLDLAQKATEKAVTDGSGHFVFSNIAAGQYQLSASRDGFKTEQSAPIAVNIGSTVRYDFKLTVGQVAESVTVTGTMAALETGQADVNTNVSQRQMEQLPLNGRNFTSIAALTPGVSTTPQANINPGGTFAVGSNFSSGGVAFTTGGLVQGSRDNGFYVNGVNITENYESSTSYEPSVEALGEGTIQVADFSAANGHDISTLSMQTKGGASTFHGSAYDYIENDAMNATNPFDKAESLLVLGTPAVKPTLRRNQFGGGVGGPVYIPHILTFLKDKAFFFANYENFIERDGSEPVYTSVPSAAERTGDFSELLSGPSPLQLYNPFFTTYDANGYSTRPAIPNNRLDLATRPDGSPLLSPASAPLLNIYPLPNVQGAPSYQPNYATTYSPGFSVYHFDTRFDAHITAKDNVFVTWSKSHGTQSNNGGIPPTDLTVSDVDDRAYLVTVNYAHVFLPNLTNEFIFGIGNGALVTLTPGEINTLNGSSNPFNQIFQNTGNGITQGALALDVYNYESPGFNEVFRAENQTFQISDNVDFTHGRHTFTAGLNYFRKGEYDWDFIRFVTFGEGSYNAGFPRQEFSSGGYNQSYAGGDGMADLVMGLPQVIHQRYNFAGGDATAPELNVVFPYWGMYVNDKFQVSPKLTLSAGLRYDLNIPLYARNNLCCAIYSPTSDGGVLKVPGIATGVPQHFLSAQKTDFAPRLSLAYNPTPRLVMRAGYGLFYDAGASQIAGALGNALNGIPGYFVGNEISNVTEGLPSDTPALGISQIFPTEPALQPGEYPVSTGTGQGYFGDGAEQAIYYYDQKSTTLPYYQRYIADVQQAVGAHDTLTFSYIGAQGRKGSNYVNINLPAYATGWPTINAFNAARPHNAGRFSDIYVQRPTLNSHYNAGVVQYQHVFSKGFQLMSNYTWGKTVSDYPWISNLSGVTGFQYPNLHNRGESQFSHRNRFVISGIWEPVYGATWSRWAKLPLTGWRLSGIATAESGDALTVVNTATTAADHAGPDELNLSGSPNLGHSQKTLFQQFNTANFSTPQEGIRGNSGLGTVRGPGQENVDLSLAKTFPIYDRFHAEFRADAFNALNHTQWNAVQTVYPYAVVGNYGNIPFGEAAGAREARIMQVGLKLAF
jgi:Carboxypeptidase regulatory-like domain